MAEETEAAVEWYVLECRSEAKKQLCGTSEKVFVLLAERGSERRNYARYGLMRVR